MKSQDLTLRRHLAPIPTAAGPDGPDGSDGSSLFLGRTPGASRVRDEARRAASGASPVLIVGEAGVGKGLVARMIHALSPRRDRPFHVARCAHIPDDVLEVDFCGDARSLQGRPGHFELAHGGTLVLERVGDLPPRLQATLVTVLDDGLVARTGSKQPLDVDVRCIATSDHDLRDDVRAGLFREDLYQRLAATLIAVPPLSERRKDIPLLADHVLERLCADQGRPPAHLESRERRLLAKRAWHGNLRELSRTLEKAMLYGDERGLDRRALAGERVSFPFPAQSEFPEGQAKERERVAAALERAGGNYCRAADLLGVSESTVRRWVRMYAIPVTPRRPGRPRKATVSPSLSTEPD